MSTKNGAIAWHSNQNKGTVMNGNIDEKIDVTVIDEIELTIEELEPIVAPGTSINHNETLVSDELEPVECGVLLVATP